jgi:hypothetical protein
LIERPGTVVFQGEARPCCAAAEDVNQDIIRTLRAAMVTRLIHPELTYGLNVTTPSNIQIYLGRSKAYLVNGFIRPWDTRSLSSFAAVYISMTESVIGLAVGLVCRRLRKQLTERMGFYLNAGELRMANTREISDMLVQAFDGAVAAKGVRTVSCPLAENIRIEAAHRDNPNRIVLRLVVYGGITDQIVSDTDRLDRYTLLAILNRLLFDDTNQSRIQGVTA